MKRYTVTLEEQEQEELSRITRKGSHHSQKVVNALILLNCDDGAFNERRVRGEDSMCTLRSRVAPEPRNTRFRLAGLRWPGTSAYRRGSPPCGSGLSQECLPTRL